MSNPNNLPEHHEDHPDVITRNARRGLFLFTIYFVLYAAFIALNVFKPEAMNATEIPIGDRVISLGGPNFAVVSGIGLIFAAIILALIYMRLTRLPDANETK